MAGLKETIASSSRRRKQAATVPNKHFDLSDVYGAVQTNSDFDFNEEAAVDSPPPSRLVYLSQTVMTGMDVFTKQPHG